MTVDEAVQDQEITTTDPTDAAVAAEIHKTDQLIEALAAALDAPSETPKIGVEAARAVLACFERVAADVELLANDHVDRARALQADAQVFAERIRSSGDQFARQIEDETARGRQISMVLREARKLIATYSPSEDAL